VRPVAKSDITDELAQNIPAKGSVRKVFLDKKQGAVDRRGSRGRQGDLRDKHTDRAASPSLSRSIPRGQAYRDGFRHTSASASASAPLVESRPYRVPVAHIDELLRLVLELRVNGGQGEETIKLFDADGKHIGADHPRYVPPWDPVLLGDSWLRNIAIDIHRSFDGCFNDPDHIPVEHYDAFERLTVAGVVPWFLTFIGTGGASSASRKAGAEKIRLYCAQHAGYIEDRVHGPVPGHVGIVVANQPVQRERRAHQHEGHHSDLVEGKAYEAYNCDTFVVIEDRLDICLELVQCGILPYQIHRSKRHYDAEELQIPSLVAAGLGHSPSADFPTAVQRILNERTNGILEKKARTVWKGRYFF